MLTASQLELMGRIIEKSVDRVVEAHEDGVTLDHAGFAAITSTVGHFLKEPEQDAAAVDLFLMIALELLEELPVPSAEGGYLAELRRRCGAR